MSDWNLEKIEKTIEEVAKTVQVAGGLVAKLASIFTRAKGRRLKDAEILEMLNGLLEVAKLENESQTKVSNAFLDLHRQQHLAMHDLAKVENEGSAKTSNAFLDLYEKSVARLRSLEARVDTLEMTTRAQTRTAANRAKRKPGRKGKT